MISSFPDNGANDLVRESGRRVCRCLRPWYQTATKLVSLQLGVAGERDRTVWSVGRLWLKAERPVANHGESSLYGVVDAEIGNSMKWRRVSVSIPASELSHLSLRGTPVPPITPAPTPMAARRGLIARTGCDEMAGSVRNQTPAKNHSNQRTGHCCRRRQD